MYVSWWSLLWTPLPFPAATVMAVRLGTPPPFCSCLRHQLIRSPSLSVLVVRRCGCGRSRTLLYSEQKAYEAFHVFTVRKSNWLLWNFECVIKSNSHLKFTVVSFCEKMSICFRCNLEILGFILFATVMENADLLDCKDAFLVALFWVRDGKGKYCNHHLAWTIRPVRQTFDIRHVSNWTLQGNGRACPTESQRATWEAFTF